MATTIAILVIIMRAKGLAAELSVTVTMSMLALISLVLLIWHLKGFKPILQIK